jgi:tripartite-type tricarboxylate transporter receptor subunit TctC
VGETVMPGFELTAWCGLSGPANLPPQITQQLAGTVERALANDTLRQRFTNAGIDVYYGDPKEFLAFVKFQLTNWTALIKDAGLQPEG